MTGLPLQTRRDQPDEIWTGVTRVARTYMTATMSADVLAAEMVRRWNAHESLLAACEALLRCEDYDGRTAHRKAGGSIVCDYCGGDLAHEDRPACPVNLARSAVRSARGGA